MHELAQHPQKNVLGNTANLVTAFNRPLKKTEEMMLGNQKVIELEGSSIITRLALLAAARERAAAV